MMKKRNFLPPLALLIFSFSAFATQLINGAGATFPYPIYSKWFCRHVGAERDLLRRAVHVVRERLPRAE